MEFPSPATDYVEKRLSLDDLCNTRAPSVYFFKATSSVECAGISPGSVLIVNSVLSPADGSVIIARLKGELRLVRYRVSSVPFLEELARPERRMPLSENELEGEECVCFGVITHVLNEARVLKDQF
ncbi:hypothetical protein M1E08_15680 [Erwinia sp. PK3-005]